MNKILIKNSVQQSGYFEVTAVLTLDVPTTTQAKMTAVSEVSTTTTEKSVTVGFKDGTQLKEVQDTLIAYYNKEQESLNNETKWTFAGIAWDGSKWSE
jgi:biotin synthase-like enzyme